MLVALVALETAAVKPIRKLTVLIHGFCYAEMVHQNTGRPERRAWQPFLEREARCADRWREQIQSFAPDEALAIMSYPHGPVGPAAEFETWAAATLGAQCLVLDAPYPHEPGFWTAADDELHKAAARELQAACAGQGDRWNKEEIATALQAWACCRQLRTMAQQRGLEWDATDFAAEAWGESFDGCALKYSLNFRSLLGLRAPIPVRFELAVPDAPFLLPATDVEELIVQDRLRCFLFRATGQSIALFTDTTWFTADPPRRVELATPPVQLIVRSKQGIRLWPDPEPYHLPQAGVGNYEPPQAVAQLKDGRLRVPITTGVVYRLAKAPAYIVANERVPHEEFRRQLLDARVVDSAE